MPNTIIINKVFEKTLVHEFHIFYSHAEWYFLSSLSENGDKICKQSAVKLYFLLCNTLKTLETIMHRYE